MNVQKFGASFADLPQTRRTALHQLHRLRYAWTVLEIERKYEVPVDLAVPDLGALKGIASVAEPEQQLLVSTYIDTADLRLFSRNITLRRRTGGTDAGWHLKLPSVEEGQRYELQLPLGRAGTVPRRFQATLAALVGDRDLVPVATLSTRRVVRRLLDEAGHPLAEVADDQVEAVTTDSDRPPVRWRELEVELVTGERVLLDRIGRELAVAGARPSTRGSKLARVVHPPAVSSTTPPTRWHDPVSALVQHRLQSQVFELVLRDPLAREDLPEGIHAMRVATRRLRSALATDGLFLDRSASAEVAEQVAWLCDQLGAARDAEVMRDRLVRAIDRVLAAEPDLAVDAQTVRGAVLTPLTTRQHEAAAAVRKALGGRRYVALLDLLHRFADDPPWTAEARGTIRAAYLPRVEHDLDRLRRRMLVAADTTLDAVARGRALHRARRAAKRARYAVEPLRSVAGEPAERLVRRLKALQATLGDRQDTVVTRAYLLDLTRSTLPALDPVAALVAGAVMELETEDSERYESMAWAAWQEVTLSEALL